MKGMDRSKLWRSPVKYARKGPRPRRGPLLTESGYAAVMAKTPSTRADSAPSWARKPSAR